MKDFPTCFGETGVQIADSSSSSAVVKAAQNLVTCVYQCKLRGRRSFIVLTWSKHLLGHALTLQIQTPPNPSLCTLHIKPSPFSKKKGSKTAALDSAAIEIHWDLSNARFGAGPEPEAGFFVAVVFDHELVFLLGDSAAEPYRKVTAAAAVFVEKREHVFGKRLYSARAQFSELGQTHDLSIECDTGVITEPSLVIRIDSETAVQVKRLRWKFRGNQTVVVDGVPVQVMWDVHNWLFGGAAVSAAVFMFQTRKDGRSGLDSCSSPSLLNSSSSSSSYSQQIRDSKLPGLGLGLDFSLILYAWRSE